MAELPTPSPHRGVEMQPMTPDADTPAVIVPAAPPGARAAGRNRAKEALRRAARRIVNAQRLTRPKSSHGVPLLQRQSVMHVLEAAGGAGMLHRGSGDAMPSDAALDLAARFVDDALHNRNPTVRIASSSGGVNMFRSFTAAAEVLLSSWLYRLVFQVVVISHCMLAWWEPLPPSQYSAAFSWSVGIIELLCLLLYTADQAMTLAAFGTHHFVDKRWESVFALTLVCAWMDWLLFYPFGLRTIFRFSRPLRPLFGLTKRKSLRRLLSTILHTLPRMLNISVLLFVLVMFYGTLGLQLFNREQVAGYSPNDDNFDSWPAAALAIFVLTTTENYPNVANSAYKARPVVATIFFVSALFIMLWFILPLILAIVYDHYKDVHKSMVQAKRIKSYLSLVYAYHTLMGADGDREMDRDTFVALVHRVRRVPEDTANLMFDVVDADGSGYITIAEFLRMPSILRLRFTRQPVIEPRPPAHARIRRWLYNAATWCRTATKQRWFLFASIAVVVAAASFGGVWSMQLQEDYDACMCVTMTIPADDQPVSPTAPTPWQRIMYDVVTTLSGAAWQQGATLQHVSPSLHRTLQAQGCAPRNDCALNPVRWSNYVCMLLALLQCVELTMRALAHESAETSRIWRIWLFASGLNAVDAVLVLWQVVGFAGLLAGAHESMPLGTSDLYEVARALPFLRIVLLVPQMRDILLTAGDILRLVFQFVLVYAGISYGFAIVGTALFGGVDQPGPTEYCQSCQMWTFDTFPRAWLALFQLTVGNNWNSILYPNIDGVGSRWTAWYFMLYRFMMTDVFMNIIEGVMIEAYSRAQEEKQASLDEARAADVMAEAHRRSTVSSVDEVHSINSTYSPRDRSASVPSNGSAPVNGKPPPPPPPAPSAARTVPVAPIRAPAPPRPGKKSSSPELTVGSPARRAARFTATGIAAIRMKRDIFEEISGEGGVGGASPFSFADSPRGDTTQRSQGGGMQLPAEDLELLEEALRRTEMQLTPRVPVAAAPVSQPSRRDQPELRAPLLAAVDEEV